jgi:tRNA dimethylallyltransferase
MHAPLLVAVVGPTGSGKSSLALAIAYQLDGEIVNCDSVQIYRHFNVGTAKLPPADRREIPHHLLDILEPWETFTAGDYSRAARQVIARIVGRERLPVIVGGTGFYLRALLEGLFESPGRDEALRRRLAARESRRPGSLHRILNRLDPGAALRIHPNDTRKLIRALEVIILARQPVSGLFGQGRDRLEGYKVLKIGLNPPREELYRRLDRRAARMFESSLLDEVRDLLAKGLSVRARPFESIGYQQALRHLGGQIPLEEAVQSAQLATRQYAKRQWTWFRKEKDVLWIDGFGENPEVQSAAISKIKESR